METFTVGPEAGKTYQSKHGYSVVADKSIDNVKPEVPPQKIATFAPFISPISVCIYS